jgi:hypothetical protein
MRFSFLALLFLLLAAQLPEPAHADDIADCSKSKDADTVIAGCTRILRRKAGSARRTASPR